MGLVLGIEIVGDDVVSVGRVFVVDVVGWVVLPGDILSDLSFVDGGKGKCVHRSFVYIASIF